MRSRDLIRLMLLSAVLGSAGCGGDDLPRQRVSGAVTFDGKPLDSGTILFMATDLGAASTEVGAVITGGSYDVPIAQGPIPGKYRVTISSTKENPIDAAKAALAKPGDGDAPVVRELIPAKYNSKTELNAEIVKGGKNVFDFPLTSK